MYCTLRQIAYPGYVHPTAPRDPNKKVIEKAEWRNSGIAKKHPLDCYEGSHDCPLPLTVENQNIPPKNTDTTRSVDCMVPTIHVWLQIRKCPMKHFTVIAVHEFRLFTVVTARVITTTVIAAVG